MPSSLPPGSAPKRSSPPAGATGATGARKAPAGRPMRPQPGVEVPAGYLAVGRIIGVHGIHGELKVEPYTDFPDRFAPGVVLAMGPTLEEVVIESGRTHKGHILLALEGMHDRNMADELRGLWLFVPEDEAVELEEDTFWVHDILGLKVVSEAGEALGVVFDVLFTGANEVYAVRTPHGGELLLPAIDSVVRAIDLDARTMTVHLMAGLADE